MERQNISNAQAETNEENKRIAQLAKEKKIKDKQANADGRAESPISRTSEPGGELKAKPLLTRTPPRGANRNAGQQGVEGYVNIGDTSSNQYDLEEAAPQGLSVDAKRKWERKKRQQMMSVLQNNNQNNPNSGHVQFQYNESERPLNVSGSTDNFQSSYDQQGTHGNYNNQYDNVALGGLDSINEGTSSGAIDGTYNSINNNNNNSNRLQNINNIHPNINFMNRSGNFNKGPLPYGAPLGGASLGHMLSGRRKYQSEHHDLTSEMGMFKEELKLEHDNLRKRLNLNNAPDDVQEDTSRSAFGADVFWNMVPRMSSYEDGRSMLQRPNASADNYFSDNNHNQSGEMGIMNGGQVSYEQHRQNVRNKERRALAMKLMQASNQGRGEDIFMKSEMNRRALERGQLPSQWDNLDALEHLTKGLSRPGTQSIPRNHSHGINSGYSVENHNSHGEYLYSGSGVAGVEREMQKPFNGQEFINIGNGNTLPQESKLYSIDGGVIFDGLSPRNGEDDPENGSLDPLRNLNNSDNGQSNNNHDALNAQGHSDLIFPKSDGNSKKNLSKPDADSNEFSIDEVHQRAREKLSALNELEKKTSENKLKVSAVAQQHVDNQNASLIKALNNNGFDITGQVDLDADDDANVLLNFLQNK
jgi:hypothetical protein